MKARLLSRATVAGAVAALVAAASAGAVIGLPADGSQVNNDPANGIDPDQNAGVSDIVGGSLAAILQGHVVKLPRRSPSARPPSCPRTGYRRRRCVIEWPRPS